MGVPEEILGRSPKIFPRAPPRGPYHASVRFYPESAPEASVCFNEKLIEWLHFMLVILDILILNKTFVNNREIFGILAVNLQKAVSR